METAPFRLLHLTEHWLAIDKAPGIGFHAQEAEPSLIDRVRATLDCEALWPVHRLDRVTSGLVLFARSADMARQLGDAFAHHRVHKEYLALADKAPSKKQGWVKGDMEKGRNGQWKLTREQTNPAVTRFFSAGLGNGLRLFRLLPQTGRTHQLRVAMKSLGSAILGDPLYNPASTADRTYLHAWRLVIPTLAIDLECPPQIGEHFVDPAFLAQLRGLGSD